MDLADAQIAVLAENQYQELELWYPLLRLREEGANVMVVGPVAEQPYASKLGYPVKPDKDMTVTIGSDSFKMYGKGDRGFVLDPTEELKLIESMKKGSSAVVKAISAKGTGTTDTYSLAGLAQALDKMATTCP